MFISTMKNRQSVKADILKTGGNSMEKGDFSQLAEDYANFRPGYNLEVVKHIIYATGLKAKDICAADIGAGTGIFSKSGGTTNGFFFITKNSSPWSIFFPLKPFLTSWHPGNKNKKINKKIG